MRRASVKSGVALIVRRDMAILGKKSLFPGLWGKSEVGTVNVKIQNKQHG